MTDKFDKRLRTWKAKVEDDADERLNELCESLNQPKSAFIRLAVQKLAKSHGVKVFDRCPEK